MNHLIPSLFLSLIYMLFGDSTQINQEEKQTIIDNRDGQSYRYVEIDNLRWLRENMRFKMNSSMHIPDSLYQPNMCGEFYTVNDAFSACPKGWRLPTELEVKNLMKMQKKKRLDIIDTLNIALCGRIDGKKIGRVGMQTTFWIDAELKDGFITHWHIFGNKQELHNHNVVHAKRQFPVRCVCDVEN